MTELSAELEGALRQNGLNQPLFCAQRLPATVDVQNPSAFEKFPFL
jgi:hypothetical protein